MQYEIINMWSALLSCFKNPDHKCTHLYMFPQLNLQFPFSYFQNLHFFNFHYTFQIDPTRTISAGKVNLGAFRTYPKVKRCLEICKCPENNNVVNATSLLWTMSFGHYFHSEYHYFFTVHDDDHFFFSRQNQISYFCIRVISLQMKGHQNIKLFL